MSLALTIDLLSALCCLFAFWKGGTGERVAAAVVVANLLIGQVGHAAPALDDQIRVANDGVTALALLAVTVRFAAPWMGAVMLFFAAQFAMHATYLVLERKGGDYLHALINNLDFIGVNLCLVIGTIAAWRGRRLQAARA